MSVSDIDDVGDPLDGPSGPRDRIAEWWDDASTKVRWLVFVVVLEILIFGIALVLDTVAGPASETNQVDQVVHVVAGMFGAIGLLIAFASLLTVIVYAGFRINSRF